jgi:hypothetical protein
MPVDNKRTFPVVIALIMDKLPMLKYFVLMGDNAKYRMVNGNWE